MKRVAQHLASHCNQMHTATATNDEKRLTKKAKHGCQNKSLIVQQGGRERGRERMREDREAETIGEQASLPRPQRPAKQRRQPKLH